MNRETGNWAEQAFAQSPWICRLAIAVARHDVGTERRAPAARRSADASARRLQVYLRLVETLLGLTPATREELFLACSKEWPEARIARHLGVSPSVVASRRANAFDTLRAALDRAFGGPEWREAVVDTMAHASIRPAPSRPIRKYLAAAVAAGSFVAASLVASTRQDDHRRASLPVASVAADAGSVGDGALAASSSYRMDDAGPQGDAR